MKKLISLGTMLTAALSLTNCAKEFQPEPQAGNVSYTIYADAPETRTVNEDMNTLWAKGDAINVFHAAAGSSAYSGNSNFTLKAGTKGEFVTENLAGELSGTNDWYVIYPYNAGVTSPAAAGVTVGASQVDTYVQVQTGNDSKAHLAGYGCPLWGCQSNVSGEEIPGVGMHQMVSVVAVEVRNTSDKPVAVSTVSFAAPQDIVGAYTADVTGETPVLTAVEGSVSNTAVLSVEGATIAAGATATYYIAVKPFKAAAGETLTMSVNGSKKTSTLSKEVTFHPGRIKTLKFEYAPKEYSGLYEKYSAGEDIVIAGRVYNKSEYGEATLLTADNEDVNIREKIHRKTGVFFLDCKGTGKFITTSIAEIQNKIVLIGNDEAGFATVAPNLCWKLMAGELVMKNIAFDMVNLDASENNDKYAFNNANATADFERLHFDDCKIKNVQLPLLYISNPANMIKSIKMCNSSVQMIATAANNMFMNLYKTTKLDVSNEIVFTNNIVYSENAVAFQLVSYDQNVAQSGTVWKGALNITNNTFYNVPAKNGYVKFYQLANIDYSRNIYYADPTYNASASYMIILYSENQTGDNCKFDDNVAFGMESGKNWDIAHSNSKYKPAPNRLKKLESTPFQMADPATGTFIPVDAYKAYGAQR